MKRNLLAVILVLLLILCSGCVSKADYDTLVKERDSLKAQVTTQQNALDSLKSNNESIKPIVTRLAKEMKALAVINSLMVEGMNIYASTGTTNTSNMSALGGTFIADFGQAINDIGDEKLSQLWKDMLQAAARMDAKGASNKLSATFALLSQMVDDDTKALQAKLR